MARTRTATQLLARMAPVSTSLELLKDDSAFVLETKAGRSGVTQSTRYPTIGSFRLEMGKVVRNEIPLVIAEATGKTSDGSFEFAAADSGFKGHLNPETGTGVVSGSLKILPKGRTRATSHSIRLGVEIATSGVITIESSPFNFRVPGTNATASAIIVLIALCGCGGDVKCGVFATLKKVSCTGTCTTGTCTLFYRDKGKTKWHPESKSTVNIDVTKEYRCRCV